MVLKIALNILCIARCWGLVQLGGVIQGFPIWLLLCQPVWQPYPQWSGFETLLENLTTMYCTAQNLNHLETRRSFYHLNTRLPCYSGDLNTDHLETLEHQTFWSSDFKWFDIQMVSLWAMSYVLDWPLEGPVPKKTRWCAFDWYSNGRAVWYSNGFQKPDCLASNLFLTTWIPN